MVREHIRIECHVKSSVTVQCRRAEDAVMQGRRAISGRDLRSAWSAEEGSRVNGDGAGDQISGFQSGVDPAHSLDGADGSHGRRAAGADFSTVVVEQAGVFY